MQKPIKLLLLIPHLGGGGAEQVASQLAQHLDPRLFEIHLGLLIADGPGSRPPPNWVHIHRIQATRVRNGAFSVLKLIRALRPDIVLSSMLHLNNMVLALRPFLPHNTKILVRQNTTASVAATSTLLKLRYRLIYSRADRILCQSKAMADDLVNNLSLPRNKITVLANPIDIEAMQSCTSDLSLAAPLPILPGPNLLSVGRLAKEKGLDLLLHAFVTVKINHPAARLFLLGTGPEKAALQHLALELGIQTAVAFVGYVPQPSAYYPSSTLFVLSSRFEGMPNALLEAAAGGLPIVSTPCCKGVTDLLENQPATWLAREVSANALAEVLLTALSELHAYQDFPPRFEHRFLVPFALQPSIQAYEQLLIQIASGQSQ